MAAKKTPPDEMFLLCLVAPGIGGVSSPYPVALFLTAADALVFASEHGVPRQPEEYRIDTAAIRDCLSSTGTSWPDAPNGDNFRPFGYMIIKFERGMPVGNALVEPYESYDPNEGNRDQSEVDPDQTLNW